MSNKVIVSATVDLKEVAQELTTSQALEAILAIDLAQADGDFTQSLIEQLVLSLRSDYGDEDLREFLKKLRKKIK